MSLQAALSKLRGNQSAISSGSRRAPGSKLTANTLDAATLSSRCPSSIGGAAVVRGAFDVPFDDAEEDDEVSSLGLQGDGAGPAPENGQGEDQSGRDQTKGGRLSTVERKCAFSFTELPQKRSVSSDSVPSGRTLNTGEGMSTGQWGVPDCAADKEEELLLALGNDWLDTEYSMGEDERSRQPQCHLDSSQTMSCQGRSLLEGRRQEQPTVKRRFPGPAGALPQLPPGQSLQQLLARQPKRPPKTPCLSTRQRACEYHHDREAADFSTGPWRDMESDLQLDSPVAAPLRKCTLSRVLKQAARKRLPSGKVAHLRVRLKAVHRAGKNARVMMHDPTGEVCGTVHCEVLEEMGPALSPGAVMLLRQVSVVSPKPRRHYLNITAANLVALYPAHGGRQTTSGGDFDLSELIAETLANTENNKQDFPSSGPSDGECPLFSQPSRPVVSVSAPAANGLCESHDQQPISWLPPGTPGVDDLDDLKGVSIADFEDWDRAEGEGLAEGPLMGQQQDSWGLTDVNASKSTGSFFSDLLREDELANFDEF